MRPAILVAWLALGCTSLCAQEASKPRDSQRAPKSKSTVSDGRAEARSKEQPASQPNEEIEIQRKLASLTSKLTTYNLLLAVVGALQFIALIVQAVVFFLTLAQMRDTTVRQLRACVCLDSAALKFPQPDVPEAQVHFKNCGQTPAYDVRGWIHTWFAEYPLKDVLPPAPDELRKGLETVAPGRTSIFVAPKKPPLAPPFLASLGTAEFTLYVYGEVRYRDVFGKERFTKYRLIHGGTEGVRRTVDKTGTEQWLLKPDVEGNEGD